MFILQIDTVLDLPEHPSPCPVSLKHTASSVHHVLSAKEVRMQAQHHRQSLRLECNHYGAKTDSYLSKKQTVKQAILYKYLKTKPRCSNTTAVMSYRKCQPGSAAKSSCLIYNLQPHLNLCYSADLSRCRTTSHSLQTIS